MHRLRDETVRHDICSIAYRVAQACVHGPGSVCKESAIGLLQEGICPFVPLPTCNMEALYRNLLTDPLYIAAILAYDVVQGCSTSVCLIVYFNSFDACAWSVPCKPACCESAVTLFQLKVWVLV